MDKIPVVLGESFRDRWKGLAVNLVDYDLAMFAVNTMNRDYDQEIHDLFEYDSFNFDPELHVAMEDD